jgi:energy-coupling factor transporter ATP-binding protein EcfA2
MPISKADQKKLVTSFESMAENDFSKQVLMPLLTRLGYGRVEFHGGVNEMGKDLIAWRTDPFGTLEPSVFVVKKLTHSIAANKKDSFHTSVTQMEQAAESEIPMIDGVRRIPVEVCFVTPHPVSTKMLESRFSAAARIRKNRCKYLDGEKIAELCSQHYPQLCQAILGSSVSVKEALNRLYTNQAVLKSLGADCMVSVDTFHVGLDCEIGSRSLRQLTATKYTQKKEEVIFQESENVDVLELLGEFSIETRIASSKKEGERDTSLRPSDVQQALRKQETMLSKRIAELRELGEQTRDALRKQRQKTTSMRQVLAERESSVTSLPSRERVQDPLKTPYLTMRLHELKAEIRKSEKNEAALEKFQRRSMELESEPLDQERAAVLRQYGKRLDGILQNGSTADAIVKEIVGLRNEIEQTAKALSLEDGIGDSDTSCRCMAVDVRGVLAVTAELQSDLAKVFKRDNCQLEKLPAGFAGTGKTGAILGSLLSFLLRHDAIEQASEESLEDVTINLQSLLQNNSLLLLGEAGSGKSTSLQAYAQQTARSSGDERFIVYAPLGHLVRVSEAPIHDSGSLTKALVKYLRELDVDIPHGELVTMLSAPDSVLVLDAIDEAYSADESVVEGIAALRQQFPNLQLHVSSRELRIPYAALQMPTVSLKPFTEHQLNQFIDRYCESRGFGSCCGQILDHLDDNPVLLEVLRTPLLATTLCELAFSSNSSLPDSEIQLYKDRFHMLSGSVDAAKNIRPRIKTRPDDLRFLCQKIAVALHIERSRSMYRLEVVEMLIDSEGARDSRDLLNEQVNELIDPCQLLVYMDGKDRVGFGHLRFQEFFVASELLTWQSQQLNEFLRDPWWSDVFCLYAKMNKNLFQFLSNLQPRFFDEQARSTVKKMMMFLTSRECQSLWPEDGRSIAERSVIRELKS